ncbi:MAG: hypothetical protein ACQESR_27240, partial [Planctomycetota bacterium]
NLPVLESSCPRIFLSSNLPVVPYRAKCQLMEGNMGPVELAEWTVGNPFLKNLDVFGGRFDRKILRQENRVLQPVIKPSSHFQTPLDYGTSAWFYDGALWKDQRQTAKYLYSLS